MKVFAYGSNMLTARLLERAPSAIAQGIGYVTGRALRWHKAGLDGSGKADLFRTGEATDRVWGVVYIIDPAHQPDLDRAESLGTGYAHTRVRVHTDRDGDVKALAYTALPTALEPDLLPFCWYRQLVVHGAEEHDLPADYIETLRDQDCTLDPDPERRTRHTRMLKAHDVLRGGRDVGAEEE